MAKNIERLAQKLGAEVMAELPDVGGGAFGAARLARILRERLDLAAAGKGDERQPRAAAENRHV